jgi:hypothetical protein
MEYRLHYVHGATGIRYAKAFDCASDDEALQIAEEMATDKHVELWREDRLIKRFALQPEKRSAEEVQALMDKIN